MKRLDFNNISLDTNKVRTSSTLDNLGAGFPPYYRGKDVLGVIQQPLKHKIILKKSVLSFDFLSNTPVTFDIYFQIKNNQSIKQIVDYCLKNSINKPIYISLNIDSKLLTFLELLIHHLITNKIPNTYINISINFNTKHKKEYPKISSYILSAFNFLDKSNYNLNEIVFFNNKNAYTERTILKRITNTLHLVKKTIEKAKKNNKSIDLLALFSISFFKKSTYPLTVTTYRVTRLMWYRLMNNYTNNENYKKVNCFLQINNSNCLPVTLQAQLAGVDVIKHKISSIEDIEKIKTYESFLTNTCLTNQVIDPLGGSTFIENLAAEWIKHLTF